MRLLCFNKNFLLTYLLNVLQQRLLVYAVSPCHTGRRTDDGGRLSSCRTVETGLESNLERR